MRGAIVVGAVMVVACSSSSSGGPPNLYQTWAYVDSAGTAGAGATFTSDGTYELQILELTSSNSGDDQVEIGTFTTSGSTLTLTPKQSTCAGPDAVYSMGYSFSGGNLVLALPSGTIVMQPDTATASDVAITNGCFGDAGAFTSEPLAPVSN
jgi:hypothetical protein